MMKAEGPPLVPVATPLRTMVSGAAYPESVVLLVIADAPIGLITFQEKLMVQLLAPEAMTQVGEAEVRVPEVLVVAHTLPFQVVPEAQLEVTSF